jgi:transcription factor TFIIIB component B''
MSTLISSATSGKKAAPKAPPRRRPAGHPAPAATTPPAKPAPKPVAEQITAESSSTSNPTPGLVAAPPTPPPTQQSPVRQTTEIQHVRFAEPVTSIERSHQPTPTSHAQPVPTPPAIQAIVPSTEQISNAVPSAPSAASASQARLGPQHQEPILGQDALQGYSHVGGSTPPPAYLPDSASNTGISSGSSVAQVESANRTEESAVANSAQENVTGDVNDEVSSATTPTTATRPAKRARAAASESGPRKAPKRNSTRSNALAQVQVEDGAVPGPSQTPRRPPVARMMATGQDPTEDATMSDATAPQDDAAVAPRKAPATRKPRKVKTPARVDEAETVEGQEGEQPAAKAKKPRKPRQKAAPKPLAKKATPVGDAEGKAQDETNADEEEPESDPELHEIDPEALSMYTITKQKRYGKTSEREKKMAEIDWEDVKRKRRAEAEGFSADAAQPPNAQQQDANASTEGATATDKQDATTRAVEGGLGFRVVNGEIVEDEETLQIDRRAQAQAEIAMQAPVEEEDELTRFHNRATYMNDRKRDEKDRVPMWKSKSDPWSEDETDRFYDALKNWGTDFMIISQLFPPKTRAQIKKKFNREERLDPERVNAALLGKDPVRAMDLNAYALAANLDVAAFNKFDSLEHAQSLISESMKDKEEAMRIAVKEAEETERQRAVHEAGKKKGREGAEERRKLAQAKKAMRSKGMVWGTGTFGGFGGGGDEEGAGES